jgi:hypothetical protein
MANASFCESGSGSSVFRQRFITELRALSTINTYSGNYLEFRKNAFLRLATIETCAFYEYVELNSQPGGIVPKIIEILNTGGFLDDCTLISNANYLALTLVNTWLFYNPGKFLSDKHPNEHWQNGLNYAVMLVIEAKQKADLENWYFQFDFDSALNWTITYCGPWMSAEKSPLAG